MRSAAMIGVAVTLWLGLSSMVSAAPGKTLVLSVEEDGVWHRALQHDLEAKLRARGVLVADALLTDAERACRERRCLLQLGLAHDASTVLVATHHSASRLLDVFLFEPSERIAQKRSEVVAPSDRSDRLVALSAELLKLPAPDPESVQGPQQSPSTSEQRPSHWTLETVPKWRRGLGLGLGILSVGALAIGAWAHTQHGHAEVLNGANGRLNMLPLFAPAYAVAGASLVGMSLSFFLSRTSAKERVR